MPPPPSATFLRLREFVSTAFGWSNFDQPLMHLELHSSRGPIPAKGIARWNMDKKTAKHYCNVLARLDLPQSKDSQPSWLARLRTEQVVRKILQDQRTDTSKDLFLGVPKDTVINDVIGCGQADFREPFGSLSTRDRAMLYAFFNQKGHIAELLDAFNQLLGSYKFEDPPILIDVGCGPFTAGLAFACQLTKGQIFSYIGVDRAEAMMDFGETLAIGGGSNIRCDRFWTNSLTTIPWPYAVSYRPVIVVASYLLASPTIDSAKLANEINTALSKISLGHTIILYTNSTRVQPNQGLTKFSSALESYNFKEIINENGFIEYNTYSGAECRRLRYALFERKEQDTLSLEEV
jgi:hypothetical protein